MSLAPGARLGPYEIAGVLGSGGMGVVYRARDTRLDRTVAIKVLLPAVANDRDRRARFDREAKTIASLNHPHICTLYDVGDHEGSTFLVMEHVAGETLADRLKRGPLRLDEALRVATEIAEALAVAHRQGVIHRDLKPANVMLTSAGVKLLDFGLAKLKVGAAEMRTALSLLSTQQTSTAEGTILGTVPYMPPEQLEGLETDARSDIWALGCVLYEMLTGRRAFQGQSTISTITAITRDEPVPPRELVKGLPPDAETIVLRCLRKSPDKRYASAWEVERRLEECRALISASTSGIGLRALLRRSRRPSIAFPALAVVVLIIGLSAWWLHRSANIRWARSEALPRIAQLVEQERQGEAFALATRAAEYIPDDRMLANLWPRMSWAPSIRTTPPGATIFRRDYAASDAAWQIVGRSPIDKHRFPLVDSQWRFELEGFAPVERATVCLWGMMLPAGSMSVAFEGESTAPGMVHQTGAFKSWTVTAFDKTTVGLLGLPGLDDVPAVRMKDYWIDRFEVTNRQFKQFLDAGGYQKPEYWKHEFRKDGRTLSWAEAMALFRDTTGRPGPSTWVQGEYPRGEDNLPVVGVSWYEAAAYAEFAGKTLPTIYHWATAASPLLSASILPASNFGGRGPAPVGSFRGMSWFGAYDMGGNVKEWCWNEAAPGTRYILGGAWDEPAYAFNNADARPAFERSANFGFRCAKYSREDAAAKARDPVVVSVRDFDREQPVSDTVFALYKSLYSYDKTPLRAVAEPAGETDDWTREKITFDAAYGNERVIAYLFLPRRSKPPFQTVVHFPGSETIDIRSSAKLPAFEMFFVDLQIKSGRALLFPVYKGTLERGDGLASDYPNTSSFWRDHVIAWSKDLGRSIDYLETRPEIDRNRIAYEGVSWGAAMGAILPALEDRIKACVLVVGGFNFQRSLPEVDELNFAPRVTVPVLMLNGKFDFFYPVKTSQEPMFRRLGTPPEHKVRKEYDTGHNVPRNELIKETLDWLDRYLGPVK